MSYEVGHKRPPKNRQFGQPEGNKPNCKRPKGVKNKETIWFEAMKEIAETFKLEEGVDEVKREVVKTGFKQAFKGNYQFWNKMITELKLAEGDTLKIDTSDIVSDITFKIVKPKDEKEKKEEEEKQDKEQDETSQDK